MTKNVQVSYFETLRSKNPVSICPESFIRAIRSGKWKTACESYRELMASGRAEEAGRIKSSMPGITVAGEFQGGHKASQLTRLSGLLCLDIDKYEGDMETLRQCYNAQPETVASFLSISGKGLKVIIRISIEKPQEYTAIYLQVMQHFTRLTGVAPDGQCKDLPRLTFGAYDPQAYYNPAATPFAAPAPQGELTLFFEEAESRLPMLPGSRNGNLLKLANLAARQGFSQAEVTAESIRRYRAGDFTEGEIIQVVSNGWSHGAAFSEGEKQGRGLKKGSGLTIRPSDREKESEDTFLEDEILRSSMPSVPIELFDNLPDILKRGMQIIKQERGRDMLLLGMISVLSGCIPNVTFNYRRKRNSIHLYFFGVAHAGTGKGAVDLARLLAEPLHDFYWKASEEKMKKFEELQQEWEMELKTALKMRKKPDHSKKPQEPLCEYLLIPANSSKIQLITHLQANRTLGGIIHSTEADDLSGAIGQEYGKQGDTLRKAFHHEVVSASFKTSGKPIRVVSPRLAVCLTGTPSQMAKLIPTTEDGLYSRFALLTLPAGYQWSSVDNEQGIDDEDLFYNLGKEVLAMHKKLLTSPTTVCFTPAQWRRHHFFFQDRLKQVEIEAAPFATAIVFRHGLIAARIAALFTTLRKCEENFYSNQRYCSDADFDAALTITRVCLEHSLLLSSSIKKSSTEVLPLRQFHKLKAFLDLLPESFTYSQMKEIVICHGISLATAKRYLKKAVEFNLLIHSSVIYEKVPCERLEGRIVSPEPFLSPDSAQEPCEK